MKHITIVAVGDQKSISYNLTDDETSILLAILEEAKDDYRLDLSASKEAKERADILKILKVIDTILEVADE